MNNRRIFFKQALTNCISFFDEMRGKPQFRIDSLWELKRETLEKITPGICPDISIKIENNKVFAHSNKGEQLTELFKLDLKNSFVFNLINGQHTIDSIVNRTQSRFGLPAEEVYQFVRLFFLDLVKKGACIPVNNVGKSTWVTINEN